MTNAPKPDLNNHKNLLRRSISSALGTIFLAAPTLAAIPTIEREALMALYSETDGVGWSVNDNWTGPPGSECSWFGVICNEDQTTVEILDLTFNGLVGPIPQELGDLHSLTTLDLGRNGLTGSIPSELGGLTHLIVLDLSNNELDGPIPQELDGLQRLTDLSLETNFLTGSIPDELSELIELQFLSLGNNQLDGTIPSSLGDLANLVELYLQGNDLTGPIPLELTQLHELEILSLHRNGLSGTIPPEISRLDQLQQLHLHFNDLSGSIPLVLSDMSELRLLNLNNNRISGSIPAELGDLTELVGLSLNNNLLSGTIPAELGGLEDLGLLILRANQLSGTIPPELEGLRNLSILDLSANDLEGQIPAELGSLPGLSFLNLSSNLLTGQMPIELTDLSMLTRLSLDSNLLTGEIAPDLERLTNLSILSLTNNDFFGSIPPELGNLQNLTNLQLTGNRLHGSIPAHLGNLTNLRLLALGSNRLSGPIPPSLGHLTAMITLILSQNELEGPIPPELGDLSRLAVLDLGRNQLTGAIPFELWGLTRLESLKLSHNRLSGPIGEEIGNLTSLTRLELLSNRFSGELPRTLTDLTSLPDQRLDFRYNALFSNDEVLNLFLDAKHSGDYRLTQTIAPSDISTHPRSTTEIEIRWSPIPFIALEGGYKISYGTEPGGPYSFFEQVPDKASSSWIVDGLLPATTYFFIIQTQTDAHSNNQNIVVSDPSQELTGTTSSDPDLPPPTSPFSEISTPLAGVTQASVDWGDYDNDGDLDIALNGNNIFNAGTTKIYRNEGSDTFLDIGAPLVISQAGELAWGDYDNDGDLDLLVTGLSDSSLSISKIYRNDGNDSFINTEAGLVGVWHSSVDWGDYDNDGDLDILLAGDSTDGVDLTKIYRNDGNDVFTDIGAPLLGVNRGTVEWADHDQDGDLDILLTGFAETFHTKIYRNDGNDIFVDLVTPLVDLYIGSTSWGDYDNDGDLDILLTGGDCCTRYARIYRNDGSGSFQDVEAGLAGLVHSSAEWGDYDNDGDLDILLTGDILHPNLITRVYRNLGDDAFIDIEAGLSGVRFGRAAWGDYDADGDLDLLVVGASDTRREARIYRNNAELSNTVPEPPSSLEAEVSGDSALLQWDSGSDAQTPTAGLTYNLRIGRSSGHGEILAPMAETDTGNRRVARMGNVQQNTSWTIRGLPAGDYYWSVQTIDSAFAGSPFATEGRFSISGGDLLAHWPLDDGSGVVASDQSGHGNDGISTGSPIWSDGQQGGALVFDGTDDFLRIDDPGADWDLDITEALTIALWVNPRSLTETQELLSKDNAFEFEIGHADEPERYSLRLNNVRAGQGSARLRADAWQHLAVTWDGTEVTYFYNGIANGRVAFDGLLNTSDQAIGLGARPASPLSGGPVFFFDGALDDVRLYGRALDAEEIAGLFISSAHADTESDLVGSWSFDDTEVCTVEDSAGTNNGNLAPSCPGNAPTRVAGTVGTALAFDGVDDTVLVPASASLDAPALLTLSAWIEQAPIGQYRAILDKRDGAGTDGYDLYVTAEHRLFLRVNDSTLQSTKVVADGAWHHVVGIYDGTRLLLYVDGFLDSSLEVGPKTIDTVGDLHLGRHFLLPDFPFPGKLDEVRVYERALSSLDVAILYHQDRP